MKKNSIVAAACVLVHILSTIWPAASAGELRLNGRQFTLPDGFELQLVAGPPLIQRPICADFDEQGRLYVADSSGSNEPIGTQLEKKPHRIVRLEDTNGDGVFDRTLVFADRMAFPEGALWYDGSLYVAAPPQIWKLTDSDADGVADQREIWFDGKTLTHCANDLHGPYLGRDGWFYWCKGAFAEQTYERPGREPLITRAAHIFRRRPEGGPVEPVMTGGMDNPVEVVFSPGGERFFTTTFLQHARDGKRDGVIHAIYGGVYGKQQGALDGHPRTGDLMPALSHLGAAAPCGLAHLETSQLGDDFQGNLLVCLFNMHKITRHILKPMGGSFQSRHEDFLTSSDLDFHPTDVLEDADGSLIVIDTGGWYKICCPTSQLHKPDVLGSIYRVRRKGAHSVSDPRGRRMEWDRADVVVLADRFMDERPSVRRRAQEMLIRHGSRAVPTLAKHMVSPVDSVRLRAVWTLSQVDSDGARHSIRQALTDEDPLVRQAAAHSASVWRDDQAVPALVQLLNNPSLHNRRVAAEALGRIGDAAAVPAILDAARDSRDRVLEHSIIFSLIEIADGESTRAGLASDNSHTRRVALIALDQMPGANLAPSDVVPLLSSDDAILRHTAWWLTERHTEWAEALAGFYEGSLRGDMNGESRTAAQRLAGFAQDPTIQGVMSAALGDRQLRRETKLILLDAMAASRVKQVPTAWSKHLKRLLSAPDLQLVGATVSTIHALSKAQLDPRLADDLRAIATDVRFDPQLRLEALGAALAIPNESKLGVEPDTLRFVCECLSVDQSVNLRSLAVDIIDATVLTTENLLQMTDALVGTGPMEIKRLLPVFEKLPYEQVGIALVEALNKCDGAAALDPLDLKTRLAKFPESVSAHAVPLLKKLTNQNKDKLDQMEAVLSLLDKADPRRGQSIFHSKKAACAACHQMGYVGSHVGPSLTRIGRIRSERDLVESVMFPNASFVRSYEPIVIVTSDGAVHNGVIKDENSTEVVLSLDAQKVARIAVDDIEERYAGNVSIMPEGLDKQFSSQDLADLIKFLKISE